MNRLFLELYGRFLGEYLYSIDLILYKDGEMYNVGRAICVCVCAYVCVFVRDGKKSRIVEYLFIKFGFRSKKKKIFNFFGYYYIYF